MPSNVADVAIEDVKTDLSSGKLSAAVFSANPTVADQEKLPTYIVPIEEKAGKNLKGKVSAFSIPNPVLFVEMASRRSRNYCKRFPAHNRKSAY